MVELFNLSKTERGYGLKQKEAREFQQHLKQKNIQPIHESNDKFIELKQAQQRIKDSPTKEKMFTEVQEKMERRDIRDERIGKFKKRTLSTGRKMLSTFATGGKFAHHRKELPKRIAVQTPTKEQLMLQEMFGGNDNYGTGRNLPKIEGLLVKGGGLIKSGDNTRETASLFGIK